MTALHKTIIVAALAAAVGSGIYAVHQNTQLNARIRTLEAEQAPLSSQLQQLEKEQAQSAGQLAAMREENERLKTSAKVNEVLKLRGQVGVLRRQAAAIDARVNRPSGGLAKMMTDPAMKEFMQKAMTDKMRSMYEDLIKELNLTPEQTEQFLGILTGNASRMLTSMAAVAQGESNQVPASPPADVGTQLQAVLGDAGAGRFADFSRELPGRAMLKQLNDQLGDTALTEEQSSRLVQAIKAEPSELTEGMLGAPDKAFLGDQPEIDRFLEQVAQSNQRIVRQASAFLHPTQLDTLNTVLTKGIESRKLQAAAFFQKQ